MGSLRAALLALAITLVAVLPAWAASCPPAPPPLPDTAALVRLDDGPHDRGFLWRISAAGHVSWLYGTVHVGSPGWLAPGPHLGAALRGSDTLALEMDPLDPAIGERLQALLLQHAGRWPAGLLPRLQAQMARACLPAGLEARFPAALLLETIGLSALRERQLHAEYGSDMLLAALAHARGLPVVSLETPDTQVRALLGGSPPSDRELAEGLADVESGHLETVTLSWVSAWASGDWEHMRRYADWCDCLRTAQDRREMRELVDRRNPDLARSIDRLHRSGRRVLAAVGALHMVGPQGLVALLQQRGYTVELVPPAP